MFLPQCSCSAHFTLPAPELHGVCCHCSPTSDSIMTMWFRKIEKTSFHSVPLGASCWCSWSRVKSSLLFLTAESLIFCTQYTIIPYQPALLRQRFAQCFLKYIPLCGILPSFAHCCVLSFVGFFVKIWQLWEKGLCFLILGIGKNNLEITTNVLNTFSSFDDNIIL